MGHPKQRPKSQINIIKNKFIIIKSIKIIYYIYVAAKKDVKRLINKKKLPGSPRKEVNTAKAVTTLKKATKSKSTGKES